MKKTLSALFAVTTICAFSVSAIENENLQCVNTQTNQVVPEATCVVSSATTTSTESGQESTATTESSESSTQQIVLWDRNDGSKIGQLVETAPVESSQLAVASSAGSPVITEASKAVATISSAAPASTRKTTRRKIIKSSSVTDIYPEPPALWVNGRSVINSNGSAVVAVPVAKPGYISGVTASGEVLSIPRGEVTEIQTVELEKKSAGVWTVNGESQKTVAGEYVVVVPVARPGYVSAVTETGAIVMFPVQKKIIAQEKTQAIAVAPAPAAPVAVTTAVVTQPAQPSVTTAQVSRTVVYGSAPATATVAVTSSSESLIAQEMKASQQSVAKVKQTRTNPYKSYAMGVVGAGAYPQVNNVDTGFAISVALGRYYRENFMLEGGLTLAKYNLGVRNSLLLNRTDQFDVNQYQAHGAFKYQIVNAAVANVTPIIGTLATYSYRNYSLTNGLTNNSGDTGNSQALDAGFVAGLDYQVDAKYAFGIDFKYMFNLSNQVNANYVNPSLGYTGTPIEELQYYTVGASARINF